MADKEYNVFDSENIDAQIKEAKTLLQQQKEEIKRLEEMKSSAEQLDEIKGILEIRVTSLGLSITLSPINAKALRLTPNYIEYKATSSTTIDLWFSDKIFKNTQSYFRDTFKVDYPGHQFYEDRQRESATMVGFLTKQQYEEWYNKIFSDMGQDLSTIELMTRKFILDYEIPEFIKLFLINHYHKLKDEYNFCQETKDKILFTLDAFMKLRASILGLPCETKVSFSQCRRESLTDFDAGKLFIDRVVKERKSQEAKAQKTTKKTTKTKKATKKEDDLNIGHSCQKKNEIAPLITEEQQEQLESLFEQDIKDYDEDQLDMIEDSPEKEQLRKEAQESEHDRAIKVLEALGAARAEATKPYTSKRFRSFAEAKEYYEFIDKTQNYLFTDGEAQIVHYIKENKWGIYFDGQDFDPETMEIVY